jgi:hypothetical protein
MLIYFKEMLCLSKKPIDKTKKRNKKIAKEQLLLVHCNKSWFFFLLLCICILLSYQNILFIVPFVLEYISFIFLITKRLVTLF